MTGNRLDEVKARQLAATMPSFGMQDILALMFLAAGVTAFCFGALDEGISPGDGAGSAAYLWHYSRVLPGEPLGPTWCPDWLCGHSLVLLRAAPLEFYFGYPFVKAYGAMAGTRAAWLCFTVLAALLMYAYGRVRFGPFLPSMLAGFAFAVHPICISFGVRPGHLEIPFFYGLMPLVLLALHLLAWKRTFGRIVFCSATTCVIVLIDIERAASLLPFAVLLFAYESVVEFGDPDVPVGRRLLRRWLSPMIQVGVICGGLLLFAAVPAFVEASHHYLFDPEYLQEGIRRHSFNNPFFLLDGDGQLTRGWGRLLSGELVANGGKLYVGIAPLLLALAALPLAGRKVGKNWGDVLLGILLLALLLSFGPYSVYERTGTVIDGLLASESFRTSPSYRLFLCALGLLLLVPATFALIRCLRDTQAGYRRRAVRWGWTCFVLVPAFFFLRPFMLMRAHLPVYSQMRGVAYLFSAYPPFALAALCGVFLSEAKYRIRKPAYLGLSLLCIAIVVLDFLPYRRFFGERARRDIAQDVMRTSLFLRRQEGWFRFLSRETYNPLSEMIVVKSGKPDAWGWLDWDSTKGTGRLFLDRIHPKLHRPETIDEALRLAGCAGVRYVIYSLVDGPPPPKTEFLRPVKRLRTIAVYENLRFRPFVQIYKAPKGMLAEQSEPLELIGETAVRRQSWKRPNALRIEVVAELKEPALVVVSESWFPGWRAEVNGEPQRIEKYLGAFQAVRVPKGRSMIVFYYRSPWYYLVSAALSGLTALTVILLCAPRVRRFCLRSWLRISRALPEQSNGTD